MKPQFNFADRNFISPNLANRLLTGVVLVLAVLLAGQFWGFLALRAENAGLRQLAAGRPDHSPGADASLVPPSEDRLKRQAALIGFANEILHKDAFQWSVLLDRLEQTLTEGVSLESIGPDPKDGSVRLVGRALNIDRLRSYLGGLSRSEWFSDAYLLEQSRVAPKKPGEQSFLHFGIKVKKAF
jgi:Tfp pilus assembly protein PilN